MPVKDSRLAQEVEKIENILGRLKEEVDRGTPLIVEGKNDIIALNRLKISGRMIALKSNRNSIFNQLEYDIPGREVIIFTDFDRRGSDLAKSIRNHLQRRGKRVNILFWKRVKKLVGRYVKDVEGLPSYLVKLRRLSGKTPPDLPV
ncbi:toprim domain-containing protein [Candidatus Bathyarchaeota archaeon]|nr:toprim domain-containing protein [Candidatus Bathyarchaeota archaeon]